MPRRIYPSVLSALPNMVAVASSTSSDQRSSFSNYGATSVHLAAPGSAILSTAPGNGYGIAQGTSMATPHVSGAAPLALSMCSVTTPQLKSLLLDTVDRVPAFSGITTTGGRLNVRAAVQNCPYPKVTSLTLTPSVAAPRALGTTVTWTAVAEGGQGPSVPLYVWDGTAWSLVQDWSTANTFAWTPSIANLSYKVTVHVRSAWKTQGYELGVATTVRDRTARLERHPDVRPRGTAASWYPCDVDGVGGGWAGSVPRTGSSCGMAWPGRTRVRGTRATCSRGRHRVANPDYKVAVLVRSAWNTGPNEISISKPFAIRPFATSVTLSSALASPQAAGHAGGFHRDGVGRAGAV